MQFYVKRGVGGTCALYASRK